MADDKPRIKIKLSNKKPTNLEASEEDRKIREQMLDDLQRPILREPISSGGPLFTFSAQEQTDEKIEELKEQIVKLTELLTTQADTDATRQAGSNSDMNRKKHPRIRDRQEKVKALWLDGRTIEEMAKELIYDESTIKRDMRELGLNDKK